MDGALIIRLAAALCAAFGIWVLRAAWQHPGAQAWRVPAGWAAIMASVAGWAATDHPDKGTAAGLVAVTLIAVGYISLAAARAPRRPVRAPTGRAMPEEPASGWRGAARPLAAGLLAGPAAGLVALLACAVLFAALKSAGLEHTANLVTAMFAFPVLWAGLAVTVLAETSLARAALTVLALLLVPLALLLFVY